jgi:hypothetical protein
MIRKQRSKVKVSTLWLSEEDNQNLEMVQKVFELEGRVKPSRSLVVGAGLRVLAMLATTDGAPLRFFEVSEADQTGRSRAFRDQSARYKRAQAQGA